MITPEISNNPTSEFITIKSGDVTQILNKGLIGFNPLDPFSIFFTSAEKAGAKIGEDTANATGETVKKVASSIGSAVSGVGFWILAVLLLILLIFIFKNK